MLPLIADVEWVEVHSETEALLLEGKLLKEYKPRYNTDFVDDKRFLMVRVDRLQALPVFRLTRNRTDTQSDYYGPFVHGTMLRKTLAEMRLKFGILLADARPSEFQPGHFRLYDDVRREIYGHPNEVTLSEYNQRVDEACQFLEGKSREWIAELEAEMQQRAEAREFEKAAELRDLIRSMRQTLERTRKFASTANLRSTPEGATERLQEVLALPAGPTTSNVLTSHTPRGPSSLRPWSASKRESPAVPTTAGSESKGTLAMTTFDPWKRWSVADTSASTGRDNHCQTSW
jgi:excinuclease ABC subunit C